MRRLSCLTLPLSAAGVALVSLAAMWAFPSHDATLLIGLAGLMAYTVAAPVMALLGRSFWLSGLLAAVSWLCLFAALAGGGEAISGQRAGDDLMVMLLPFMAFPLLLGAAGLARLLWWLRARARIKQAVEPA